VAATSLIDARGIIRWAHARDDYPRLAEPAEAVEPLRALPNPTSAAQAGGAA